jgi:hypothetical protein
MKGPSFFVVGSQESQLVQSEGNKWREGDFVIPPPYHRISPHIICNSGYIFSMSCKTTIYEAFISGHMVEECVVCSLERRISPVPESMKEKRK